MPLGIAYGYFLGKDEELSWFWVGKVSEWWHVVHTCDSLAAELRSRWGRLSLVAFFVTAAYARHFLPTILLRLLWSASCDFYLLQLLEDGRIVSYLHSQKPKSSLRMSSFTRRAGLISAHHGGQ